MRASSSRDLNKQINTIDMNIDKEISVIQYEHEKEKQLEKTSNSITNMLNAINSNSNVEKKQIIPTQRNNFNNNVIYNNNYNYNVIKDNNPTSTSGTNYLFNQNFDKIKSDQNKSTTSNSNKSQSSKNQPQVILNNVERKNNDQPTSKLIKSILCNLNSHIFSLNYIYYVKN